MAKCHANKVNAHALGLSANAVPRAALDVIERLTNAGFSAYVVGGGVRDMLLGLNPKDFDVATSARPHEIKDVFGRSARIIGRRFQLAHVYQGDELLEVATFRADAKDGHSKISSRGMVLRDNVWGSITDDFARRDFSINALYYQPHDGLVLDFCGAIDDIAARRLRLLGDAPTRIAEDPVRLLRAIRFAAKLGFDFDDALAAQFNAHNWHLLADVSPNRLYDETQKMFVGGYLSAILPLLYRYGGAQALGVRGELSKFFVALAHETDARALGDKTVNCAFVYAVWLYDDYLYHLHQQKKRGLKFNEAQIKAAQLTLKNPKLNVAIPKFAESFIVDIWHLQARLFHASNKKPNNKKRVQSVVDHPRFLAAVDFMLLAQKHCQNPLHESGQDANFWQQQASRHRLNQHDEEWAQIQSLSAASPKKSHTPKALFGQAPTPPTPKTAPKPKPAPKMTTPLGKPSPFAFRESLPKTRKRRV